MRTLLLWRKFVSRDYGWFKNASSNNE